jgi:hypothetical protein
VIDAEIEFEAVFCLPSLTGEDTGVVDKKINAPFA